MSTRISPVVGWSIGGVITACALIVMFVLPMPTFGGADTVPSGSRYVDVRLPGSIVVPRRGPVPSAVAQVMTVQLLCPYFADQGELAGCTRLDGSPMISSSAPLGLDERCWLTRIGAQLARC